MKKSITVDIPNIKKSPSRKEKIINVISKKPCSAKQISHAINMSLYNTAPILSNLKTDGVVREKLCPCCQVGKVYEVAK